MRLQHPRAREDVPGKPPAKIDLGDRTVPVDRDGGGTFAASGSFGEALAGRFGLELADLEPGADPVEPEEPAEPEGDDVGSGGEGMEYEERNILAEELANEHWATAKAAVESGEADSYLDILERVDDRDSVQDAIDERRPEAE